MAKTVLKEIIIILLLCLAIILILGILLYDYVPIAKVIPEEVSYTTPENIQKEIAEEDTVEPVIYTYEVQAEDLNTYKRTQEYQAGKANPFSDINSQPAQETQNGTSSNGGTSNSGTSNNSNSSSSSNSGNETTTTDNSNTSNNQGYYPDKGTK